MLLAERSGKFPPILKALAAELAALSKLRWRLILLMIYPALLMLIWLVLFPLADLAMQGSQSVASGKSLDLAHLLQTYLARLLGRFAGLGVAAWLLWQIPRLARQRLGEAGFNDALMRLPIIGKLWRLHKQSQFARNASLALGAGLAATESLELAAKATVSATYEKATQQILAQVRRGSTLSEALVATDGQLLSNDALGPLSNAEASGDLSLAFSELSGEWQQKLEHRLNILNATLSSLLLALMAVAVIVVVARQYNRIFESVLDITGNIK